MPSKRRYWYAAIWGKWTGDGKRERWPVRFTEKEYRDEWVAAVVDTLDPMSEGWRTVLDGAEARKNKEWFLM